MVSPVVEVTIGLAEEVAQEADQADQVDQARALEEAVQSCTNLRSGHNQDKGRADEEVGGVPDQDTEVNDGTE